MIGWNSNVACCWGLSLLHGFLSIIVPLSPSSIGVLCLRLQDFVPFPKPAFFFRRGVLLRGVMWITNYWCSLLFFSCQWSWSPLIFPLPSYFSDFKIDVACSCKSNLQTSIIEQVTFWDIHVFYTWCSTFLSHCLHYLLMKYQRCYCTVFQNTDLKVITREEPTVSDVSVIENLMQNHDSLLSSFRSRLTKLQVNWRRLFKTSAVNYCVCKSLTCVKSFWWTIWALAIYRTNMFFSNIDHFTLDTEFIWQ